MRDLDLYVCAAAAAAALTTLSHEYRTDKNLGMELARAYKKHDLDALLDMFQGDDRRYACPKDFRFKEHGDVQLLKNLYNGRQTDPQR
jgi:hypothetical protein